MELPRAFGLLLHPTSLPGPYGVGVLGQEARDFLRFLKEAGGGTGRSSPWAPRAMATPPTSPSAPSPETPTS